MAEKKSKYGFMGKLNPEDLYNAFMGLEQREQTIAVIGTVVLLLVLVFLPVTCASGRIGKLNEDYQKSFKAVDQLNQKLREYRGNQLAVEAIKDQYAAAGKETLPTLLEAITNEIGLPSSSVENLKPVNLESTDFYDEVGVEAKFSKLSLEQVTQLVHRIESESKVPLRVKKMDVKPSYQNRQLLTVTMTVSTIRVKEDVDE